MKRILITGGNGNIGQLLYRRLSSLYEVTCLTRETVDLLQIDQIRSYLDQHSFDILIHTAVVGGRRTNHEEDTIVYQNISMFLHLMAFHQRFQRIIHFDSGAIYDRNTSIENRKEEDLFTIPKDQYGFSKYMIYQLSQLYSNVYHLRLFNLFHIHEEPDRFIKACFFAKKNNTSIQIDENKYFDFMYEDDFILIIRFYIEQNNLLRTINVCYPQKYTLYEIAKKILYNESLIHVKNSSFLHYTGDSTLLESFHLQFDGLDKSLEKYEQKYFT